MTIAPTRKKQFANLNRRLAAMVEKGKTATVRVDVFDTMSVLFGDADPRIRPGAMQYMRQAIQTAMGTTEDRLTCFCCCREWSMERVLSAFLVVEFLNFPDIPKGPNGMMAGLCPDCVNDHALIVKSVRRDFAGANGEVRFLSEGGHA